jgi:hypothetical protein
LAGEAQGHGHGFFLGESEKEVDCNGLLTFGVVVVASWGALCQDESETLRSLVVVSVVGS